MKAAFLLLILVSSFSTSFTNATEVLVYRHETMPWCGTIDGRDAGVTVEILEQITLHGGPSFRYQSMPWPRALKMVHKTKGSLIIPLTRTPTREPHFSWIVPLVPNQIRLTLYDEFATKGTQASDLTLEKSKWLSVGVIQGSSIIPDLEEAGFASIYEADDIRQLIDLLAKKRLDAMVESKLVDTYQWQKLGYDKQSLVAGPNIGGVNYIYLGAGLDFPPEMSKEIQLAMEKIKANGVYDEILSRWY